MKSTPLTASRAWLRWGGLPGAAVLAAALGGCATPRAVPVASAVPAAASQPLYFYPMQGQDERRQHRDRYECYRWAVQQTGRDPGMIPVGRSTRAPLATVYDPEPGRDTALGAAAGAIVGSLTASSPRHAGEAAAVGLVLGAIIGAASDQARAEEARRLNAQAAASALPPPAYDELRRAMAACMSGRGYAVR
ncbi:MULTISPECIES: glycine zipper 2TM domain-containing protein [Caldimonas]|uniref:glycine zipper 2TM domain-containing protein n=1 Tax=Caldimonas TaxID=196013 RepID=UPI000784D9D6|nr:glycine zipper 2TM domain-containing protein [Caldimonas taiwanensis]